MDIQSEMLKVMGLQVLREVSADLRASPFLTIMADETTNSSNKEQVTLIPSSVNNELEVHKEFLRLYQVTIIDAASLAAAIKDALVRMNLPFDNICGQCYDGCSAMSSSKYGVSKQIADLEPHAVYTHSLNLAAADTLKESKLMKDALDTTWEINKLIKYSPKREAIFQRLKEGLSSASTLGIGVLCPMRWTVCAKSIHSILINYDTLRRTWTEALQVTKDTEAKAHIQGVATQMSTFPYLYGSMLGKLVLKHTDNLSQTLQHASMAVATLKSLCSDDGYDLLWEQAVHKAEQLEVSEP